MSVNTLPECELAIACGQPAVFQMEYNLFEQGPAGVFCPGPCRRRRRDRACRSNAAYTLGRFDTQSTFTETDRRKQMFSPDKLPALVDKVEALEATVASLGRPLAEVAVRFCVSNPHITVTIPGIRTPEQATANAAACEPLPAPVIERLRQFA